jgi:transmembrane sensor
MTLLHPVMPWEEEEDAVSKRAADFLGQRRFGNWTDADQVELDRWLAESTLHYVAWLRLSGIAARAGALAAQNTFERKPVAPEAGNQFHYRRFVLPLLAAAAILLAASFGGPFVASLLQPQDRTDSTDIGGRTLLSFSDRTQIELNTDTAVRLRMTTGERTVWLEKGEAWFHVAHDAAHPFTVIVGKHRITDLGTEFLVHRAADNVNVTLLNGRAALSTDGMQTATLSPGEEAIATPVSLSIVRRTPQQVADELAWRQGMLVFRKTPLAEVVKQFNRYNATKLVIADPSIANVRIVAKLRADDYESFLELAQNALKLRVDREGGVVLISRNQKSEVRSRKPEAKLRAEDRP